jgi:hypothetical protein
MKRATEVTLLFGFILFVRLELTILKEFLILFKYI